MNSADPDSAFFFFYKGKAEKGREKETNDEFTFKCMCFVLR